MSQTTLLLWGVSFLAPPQHPQTQGDFVNFLCTLRIWVPLHLFQIKQESLYTLYPYTQIPNPSPLNPGHDNDDSLSIEACP